MKKLILLLICLSFSVFSFSQESELDIFEMSLEDLLNIEVTTASKRAQRITEAPATVISYSSEQIEMFGWRDLKDMFRAITGIDVSYDVQGEVKTLVTIRGVEGNQKILVLQDGQRQNPITGERFIFGHNLPLNIYKRIEIVYGPASALYGADAYAGVVNLITKDGADIDGMSASAGYVSTNAVDASLTFGKKMGEEVDVLLYGRMYNGKDFPWHEHYDDPLDYGVVNNYTGELAELENIYPIKNWNMIGKIRYKKFTLGFDWQHQLESNAPTCIPTNYAYVENNLWGQDIRHMYLNYDAYSSENLNVDATITVGDYTINPASNFFIPIDSNNDGFLNTGEAGYKYGYSGYVQGSVKADWIVNENLNFILGSSFENVISFPKTQNLTEPYHLDEGFQDDLSYFVDNNGYTFGMVGLTDEVFGERNFSNLGLFAQAEYKPIEELIFTLGGRFDYNSIYKETFNPRIGLVYKASDKLTLKGMLGTAYIAPSNYYRWENWANPYAMHIPNLEIKPEKLQSAELSAIYYLSKSFSVRTSVYRNNMKDIIRPVPAPEQEGGYPYYNPMRAEVGEDSNTGFFEVNDNLGEIYSQGAEVDINYQVSRFLISLGYSFTDGEDKTSGTSLPKVSQHKLNTNISYSNNNFFGSITARYYSDIWTDPNNTLYGVGAPSEGDIPGAFILYANLGYKLSPNVTLKASVDNALNTKHYGSAPYAESIWIQPRAPQSLIKVYGGITVDF